MEAGSMGLGNYEVGGSGGEINRGGEISDGLGDDSLEFILWCHGEWVRIR